MCRNTLSIGSGAVHVGDEVIVLPSGRRTVVEGIDTFDGELTRAFAPQSVTLRLADAVDVSRGDLITSATSALEPTQDIEGTIAWLSEGPLRVGQRVLVKHTTRLVQGLVREIKGRLDLDTLTLVASDQLALNDIGRVALRVSSPLVVEDYGTSRSTGSFLLVDPQTGGNLAAGMVRARGSADDLQAASDGLDWSI